LQSVDDVKFTLEVALSWSSSSFFSFYANLSAGDAFIPAPSLSLVGAFAVMYRRLFNGTFPDGLDAISRLPSMTPSSCSKILSGIEMGRTYSRPQ
jgi:hypothetical protein